MDQLLKITRTQTLLILWVQSLGGHTCNTCVNPMHLMLGAPVGLRPLHLDLRCVFHFKSLRFTFFCLSRFNVWSHILKNSTLFPLQFPISDFPDRLATHFQSSFYSKGAFSFPPNQKRRFSFPRNTTQWTGCVIGQERAGEDLSGSSIYYIHLQLRPHIPFPPWILITFDASQDVSK